MNNYIEPSKIISYLRSIHIVSSIKIVGIDEIFSRSVLRLRCNLLPSSYHLDIRLIQTENETIYSYQLFTDHPIVRWDNAPHFPAIKTFPHHYHKLKGEVEASPLKGFVFEDLNYVLENIKNMLVSNEI
jgi:hypothetical protein